MNGRLWSVLFSGEHMGGLAVRLIRLLLTLILLNAPFWWLADHLFLRRALFSLDSLVAALLLHLNPFIGTAAIAVSWASDLAMAASFTYNFASILDFARSAAFAQHLGWRHLLGLNAVFLAVPFVVSAIALRLVRPQRLEWSTLATVLLVLALLDTLNGSSLLSRRDVRLTGANLAGSSWLALIRMAIDEGRQSDTLSVTGSSGGISEFESFMPGIIASSDSVLYVIVESLGVHENPAIRAWVARQLYPPALETQYSLTEMQVAVNGSTTSGELRRLCGLQGSYRNLRAEAKEYCLPQAMANSGHSTVGLHGFSKEMFDRKRWWPMLGLQRVEFAEEMASDLARRCGGAFEGICDGDLIARAVTASSRPRSFVYALTLNSHLPIPPIPIPSDLTRECAAASTGADVCMLLAQLGVALRSIPLELMRQGARPHVVVVGDHPPPFGSLQDRRQFAAAFVPVLVLSPKTDQRH